MPDQCIPNAAPFYTFTKIPLMLFILTLTHCNSQLLLLNIARFIDSCRACLHFFNYHPRLLYSLCPALSTHVPRVCDALHDLPPHSAIQLLSHTNSATHYLIPPSVVLVSPHIHSEHIFFIAPFLNLSSNLKPQVSVPYTTLVL